MKGQRYIRALILVALIVSASGNAVAGGENKTQVTARIYSSYSNQVRIPHKAPVKVVQPKLYPEVPLTSDQQNFVSSVSEFYKLKCSTIFKIMYTESRFNNYSVSKTGDYGIMQVNKKYYKSYVSTGDRFDEIVSKTGSDLFDFKTNVILSCRELSYWQNTCNKRGYTKESDFLDCYNRGFSYFSSQNKSYSNRVLSVNLSNL